MAVNRKGRHLLKSPTLQRFTEVGTQSISPLYWAIESGALVCAEAMLEEPAAMRSEWRGFQCRCVKENASIPESQTVPYDAKAS